MTLLTPPANCLHISHRLCCCASGHLLRLSKRLAGGKISHSCSVSLHLFDNTRNYSFLSASWVRFLYFDRLWTERCCCSVFAWQEGLVSPCSQPCLHLWTFIDLLLNVQLTFCTLKGPYISDFARFRLGNEWMNVSVFFTDEMAHSIDAIIIQMNKQSNSNQWCTTVLFYILY